MKLKKAILSVMDRDSLQAAEDELELDGVDRRCTLSGTPSHAEGPVRSSGQGGVRPIPARLRVP